MLKKLFILMLKYLPVIEMAGILINNTCYYINIYLISNILDTCLGDSLIHNIFIFIGSLLFGFCLWHRLLIISNSINLIIALIDKEYHINISDLNLLILYYSISSIFILLATYVHIKNKKHDKYKTKNIETTVAGICGEYRCWK